MFEILRALSAGALDFATAFVFAATWWRPEWLGRAWVKTLMVTMLMEFLVVHSFGFLFAATNEGGAKSIQMLLGFGAFYLLFAAAFAAAFKTWWPVWMFGWLIGSKLWALVTGTIEPEVQRQYVTSVWMVSTCAYLFGCFATAIFPLPRLGVKGPASNYGVDSAATGLWIEQPHRVLAFGLFYFLAAGTARVVFAPI